ncbi:alpha-galactosidase [Clostridium polyendosporum]|uniref:Alpha-galactosidase n=1 Tax=Clostridium polyendosporum TaxID=69208 RepID=A0A919S3A5_9CLOT|nr:alpha-galactosidase [Clostridium polyendosporum]GIM29813.1 alpha-galactosidase [Clostridium polyendosporum]
MAIIYEQISKTFHLKSKDSSYVIKVLDTGHLVHLYWGKSINSSNLDYLVRLKNWGSFLANTDNIDEFSLEALHQEYPSYGNTDLRSPAFQLQLVDGSTITDLRYDSHKIYKGKPKLEGLPATYVENDDEADTLEITLIDKVANVRAVLLYSVFNELDVVTRSAKIINDSSEDVKILRILSSNVDYRDSEFDLIQLSGAWARERHVVRRGLTSGGQSIESRRGASGHAENPFIALVRKDTVEDKGEAYGFSLVYSGNFLANVEVDLYSNARVQLGINPFDFNWLLKSGEAFQAPEAVLVYSDKGLTGMSSTYHKIYGKRLARGKYRDAERPILINNWEATYFDFNDESIENIAREASDLGIELFVLDDGWFGKRDDDTSSLGDWFVNRDKIKNGLDTLAKNINDMGLKFGLWFEPEMVCPESELYKEHPDWCIHVNGRTRSEARKQLILDLSRQEVCDEVIKRICDVLASAPISYVKWDMNRNMTEIGSLALPAERQRETAHRYILGLYKIMDAVTSRFPDILFESCSGGGGRFDPGILYYMPQTWTSDDTDAIERLKIQFGTSMVYPSASMGCHVSAVPNHQVYRNTPINTRAVVAMAGNYGYELDVTKLSSEEKEAIKEQVNLYKEIRHIVQFGEYYRLKSPFEGNDVAWMFISEDKKEVVVSYVRQYAKPNAPFTSIKLRGLDPNGKYRLISEDSIFGGDELMYVGLNMPELRGDYQGTMFRFEKVD